MVRQEVGRREGRKPWVMKSSLRIVSIPGLFKGSSLKKKLLEKFVKLCLCSSYIQLDDFFNEKNVKKKIVKFCLNSSKILQNSFQFDDNFSKKIEKI